MFYAQMRHAYNELNIDKQNFKKIIHYKLTSDFTPSIDPAF
jgi:hypothetical protein